MGKNKKPQLANRKQQTKNYKLIVIFGPNASGKSNLALKIAKKFNGEIISADSRQVYRGLDIGSGKVPKDQNYKLQSTNSKSFNSKNLKTRKQIQNLKSKIQNSYFYKGVIHYLLDVANPKRIFTVSQYQKLAKKAVQEILAKNKIPIICGGTGLYIDALIYDYQFPKIPPQPKLRKQFEKKSTNELFQQLQKLDLRRAKNIDKYNRRRLIRALEICISTGKQIPPLNNIRANPLPRNIETDKREKDLQCPRQSASILKIGIKKLPEELKKLIKKRLLKRLSQGMIEEVKNLREKQGLSWKRLDDLGLEYRYISRYLKNFSNTPTIKLNESKEKFTLRRLAAKKHFNRNYKNGYQEMIEIILKESWKYAKRQMTWFKKDKEIHWIENNKKAEELIKNFLAERKT